MTLKEEIELEIETRKKDLIKRYSVELLTTVRKSILEAQDRVKYLKEREDKILLFINDENLEGLESLLPKSGNFSIVA
jgi:hypothetical protein